VVTVFSESTAAAGLPAGAGHRLTKFRVWSILHSAVTRPRRPERCGAMAKAVA